MSSFLSCHQLVSSRRVPLSEGRAYGMISDRTMSLGPIDLVLTDGIVPLLPYV